MYGFKQASKQWFEKLTTCLFTQGFTQAASDHTLFIKSTSTFFTVIFVYVDDIILAGTFLEKFDELKDVLHQAFCIKNFGQLKGISLFHRKYCLELLDDAGLTSCKHASTPLDPSTHLYQDGGSPYPDITAYRRLVDRLLYMTTTRPDIAFATQQLSQFMSSPTETHYKAALIVLRYLKRSPGRGLFFFPQSTDLQLFGFSDVD